MPLSNYTSQQLAFLEDFEIPSNFIANSFNFYNNKSGLTIENAIFTDINGNVIFKDKTTQSLLSDLIKNAKTITEQKDNNEYNLYFQDKFNKKISLGEIYNNVFKPNQKNLVYWFHERNAKNLEGMMDDYIIENFMNIETFHSFTENEDKDSIKYNELWKNKWIDVPCLEVVTPSYVDSKYASISAIVHFKIRCDKAVATGFRIYDATTGIELHRVIHTTQRDPGKEVTYSVPLTYQGPLPDTDNILADDYKGLTEKDLQNIQYEFQHEKGTIVEKNIGLYQALSISRHVIKVQWITCDLATEFNVIGNRLSEYSRGFDPDGVSSLDVIVYNENKQPRDITVLNGNIITSKLEPNVVTYKHVFEYRPSGITDNYALIFGVNKNVNVSILHKDNDGFLIKWDKAVTDLVIDWKITYEFKDEDESLINIYDKNRSMNHFLFSAKDYNIDFCKEIQIIKKLKFNKPEKKPNVVDTPPPPCFCCECCNGNYSVLFEVLSGSSTEPEFDPITCCENTGMLLLDPPECEEEHVYYSISDDYYNVVYSERDDFSFVANIIDEGSNCDLYFEGSQYVSAGESVAVYSEPTAEMCTPIDPPPDVDSLVDDVLPPDIIRSSSKTKAISGRDYTIIAGESVITNDYAKPFTDFISITETIDTLSMPSMYGGDDYTYKSINENDFYGRLKTLEEINSLGLKYLERDLKYNKNNLPVQNFEDNLILLDIPLPSRYISLFEPDSTFLKLSTTKNYSAILILDEAFLGSSAFKYNFAIFDPRPNITIKQGDRPLYPGYDPIYYRTKKEDILKYIYTTSYPTKLVPAFPNFRIGDYVVNGALYNPMLDIRNYRMFGRYDLTNNTKPYDIFKTTDLSLYEQNFVRGRYFKLGDLYYYIELNTKNYDNVIKVSLFKNKEQWVTPSRYLFKQVTKLEYDLNSTKHIAREF